MSYLLRIPVDVLVPESANRTQIAELVEMIKDHAGPVAVHKVFRTVVTESKPSIDWHVHDGTGPCSACRGMSADEKNASTVEATEYSS